MYRLSTFLLAALLLGLAAPAQGQDPERTTVYGPLTTSVPFLLIEPDSRATGMGNANVALANTANALFWNPAGLAFQDGIEVGITHSEWLAGLDAGLSFDNLIGRYNIDGVGTVAGHITYLNLGEQEIRDEGNNFLGNFRSYDLAFGASFAREVAPGLGIGGGARTIVSSLAPNVGEVLGIDINTGVSFAFDIAALYKMDPIAVGGGETTVQPSFGINFANLGPAISYTSAENSDNPLPSNVRFGAALQTRFDQYNRINLALDFGKLLVDREADGTFAPWYTAFFTSWGSYEVDLDGSGPDPAESLNFLRQLTVGTGVEYWYNDLFAMRAGYYYEDPRNGNRQFVTLGAGIRYSVVGVDASYIYALQEDSPLANNLRLSLLLDINR